MNRQDPHGCAPSLLVSVRSVAEARAARAGGADLIDVKEPRRGSLGRADDPTIRSIVTEVAGERLVSAAMGELLEANPLPEVSGLRFVKWGLAGCHSNLRWPQRLAHCGAAARRRSACQAVAVAYADSERADAPPWQEVVAFARERAWPVVLLDTWTKDGRTLLDWMTLPTIRDVCARCREASIQIALAGSLGPPEISVLLDCEPNWIAVRGAACGGGLRDGEIDAAAVRRLVMLLRAASQGTSVAG